MNIYVGNLSEKAMDTDLRNLFSEFGLVAEVKIVTDNFTRMSRGFAFVDMEERAHGEKAIAQLDKAVFMHQSLAVRESTHTETTKRW